MEARGSGTVSARFAGHPFRCSIFAALLIAACTDEHSGSLTPAERRLSDGFVAAMNEQCLADRPASMSVIDRRAMCSCVGREMQRTMFLQDMLDLNKSAGQDGEVRVLRLLGNKKVQRIISICVDEVYRKT